MIGSPATCVLPSLIGLEVGSARDRCDDLGLIIGSRDPDGPALGPLTWPGYFIVTGQDPAPGTTMTRGDAVAVDVEPERGSGGSDVPAPLVPQPPRLVGHASATPEGDRPRPVLRLSPTGTDRAGSA